jgi:catechol 2,3-dioxygenase-like lactoylglutathione lyase family enzyme
MKYPLTGYHHITACAGGAQEDVDFFTQVMGLRMAKQTVLMDGSIPIYHLYYSNANLEPGSVMTTFPYGRKQGRPGSGQVSATAFTVAKGSLPFWKEHLKRHKVDLSKVDAVGFADLTPGSGHGTGGYSDVAWIEVYGKPVKREGGN